MNTVERVKSICRDRKIPISRLERELGYANGYIGQLKKGTFPDTRLREISTYLNVPIDELLGENKKDPILISKDEAIKEIMRISTQLSLDELKLITSQIRGILQDRE